MYCMNLYTGIRSNKLYMVYKKDLQISRTAVFERSCPEFPLDTNCGRLSYIFDEIQGGSS